MKKIIFTFLVFISQSLFSQDFEDVFSTVIETLLQADGTQLYTCGNRNNWSSMIDIGDGWEADSNNGQTVEFIVNPSDGLNFGVAFWKSNGEIYSFSAGTVNSMVSGFVMHADMDNYVENYTYSAPNRTLYFHMQRAGDPILPNTTKTATVTCEAGLND